MPCPTLAVPTPIILDSGQEHPLAGHLELLTDPSGTLELKDIITQQHSPRFRPIDGFLNLGYTKDTAWVRLTLIRTAEYPHDPILCIWPPYLDYVTVYQQMGDDPSNPADYRTYLMGDHLPVDVRPIIDANFAAPLLLPSDKPTRLYIRVKTSSTMNLSGHIFTESEYIRAGSFNLTMQGGYLGITLVITMINLVLYLRLRDRLYLYFFLYLASLALSYFPLYGTMTLLFPSLVHTLSDYLVGMGVAGSFLFFSLFGKMLFADCASRWVARYFNLNILISLATAASVPLGHYGTMAQILFISTLASIFILTLLSIKELRRGSEGAFLYLAAFGLSNVGYGVQFLRALGIVPVAWWNMHAVEFASIFNMILMTLALTERVNRAEQRALVAARDAEARARSLAETMTLDLRSKQKELEEALESERTTLQRKERFVAMLNHEYRTPLAIIQANISILEMKTTGSTPQLVTVFSKIRKAMDRLVEVMETSLNNEHLSGEDGKNNYQLLSLESLLHGIILEAGNLWQNRRLDVDIPALPGVTVHGDPILLKTAILNLLDNAFKYSPVDKPVGISVHAGESNISIRVTDQGCGIPADQLDLVFGNKYRVPGTTADGVGIGLYLVKSVIEQHNGTIKLNSTLTVGTSATIILPLDHSRYHHE